MKLIALRDFAATPDFDNIEIADKVNSRHIHKGATFEIGGEKVTELGKLQPADRKLVAQLIYAQCVGDATDTKTVKAVKESIAEDKKREATAKALTEQADKNQLLIALTALLNKAAAPPVATK